MFIALLFFAAKRHDTDPILSLVIVLVILTAGAVGTIINAIRNEKRKKALELRGDLMHKRYKDWLAAIQQNGGDIPPIELPIILQDGEEGLYMDSAQMLETRSVRTARHGGAAFRVARGVTIGQGRTRSESHEEWRQIAAGYLYITSQRLVFDGDMQSRNIKLSEIVSVNFDANNIQIATSKRQKTMIFTSVNGYIAHAILTAAIKHQPCPKGDQTF
jgi:hypothetical protein